MLAGSRRRAIMQDVIGVLAIWRYPVKAMLGEPLDAVEIGPAGCTGDRRWIVVDADTGERIANKRGPTDPRLRACRAELLDASDDGLPLRITLPGGEVYEGSETERALSELLERRVRLEAGAHHDAMPVHLITTSTLAHLRALAPGSAWDVRRFRPNLVLDDDRQDDGFAEDALLGGRLRGASGLELSVELPTPRCVVPTRAQEELPADPRILRTVVAHHRLDLGPFGRQGCAGAYAEVVRGGRVEVGGRLEVERGRAPRDEAIRAAVARLAERLRGT
jgi:uncharacterized protein